MIRTSEYVSIGHPDRLADFISSHILDRFLERDPLTRYAVECQVKDDNVTLGGEVTSKCDPPKGELLDWVCEAIEAVGYTPEYRARWGEENAIGSDAVYTYLHIGRQSGDIACGVDRSGWGDQGIFWGMAVDSPETGYMPRDHWLARRLGEALYASGVGGIDIKTQVTMDGGRLAEVIVAIPMFPGASHAPVHDIIGRICGQGDYRVVVNGTGRFLKHGPCGDCGTTGRKLAVDFYGGNCRIGGGCPWTKDGTKADVSLNMYARYAALQYLKANPGLERVYCAISCCIGSPRVRMSFLDGRHSELCSCERDLKPADVIEMFGLRRPIFADLCRHGLFSCIPQE